jgi:hypothetical protein
MEHYYQKKDPYMIILNTLALMTFFFNWSKYVDNALDLIENFVSFLD